MAATAFFRRAHGLGSYRKVAASISVKQQSRMPWKHELTTLIVSLGPCSESEEDDVTASDKPSGSQFVNYNDITWGRLS